MLNVLVIGASGIIGQTMRLCIPDNVNAIFTRRREDILHRGLDIAAPGLIGGLQFPKTSDLHAIINLAGENNTDVVEREPEAFFEVNVKAPEMLSRWCDIRKVHYLHVSTQAVFDGTMPPYSPESPRGFVNAYGEQKIAAERKVEASGDYWTIVRPTFVMGIRPMPGVGRENPAEQMLSGKPQRQVVDRRFSIAFARDVARELWKIAIGKPVRRPVHIGLGCSTTRYGLASLVSGNVEPVLHSSFSGLAPRPIDTTYAGETANQDKTLAAGMIALEKEYRERETLSVEHRARELSIFSRRPESECLAKLNTGFGALHSAVAADFRRANPNTDDELLAWYRQTEAYCWELSAYHCDAGVPAPGFNYKGMCQGIVTRLQAAGAKRVLILGDGIGDLTLALLQRGMAAVYHDLEGSRTADFAKMRLFAQLGKEPEVLLNSGWMPQFVNVPRGTFDAVVSCDFLEHVTDVPAWVGAIQRLVKPDGLFMAQNAFACGSGPDGSIPMHLERNDRFEKDWDPMLFAMGFTQESSNWYVNGTPAATGLLGAAPEVVASRE